MAKSGSLPPRRTTHVFHCVVVDATNLRRLLVAYDTPACVNTTLYCTLRRPHPQLLEMSGSRLRCGVSERSDTSEWFVEDLITRGALHRAMERCSRWPSMATAGAIGERIYAFQGGLVPARRRRRRVRARLLTLESAWLAEPGRPECGPRQASLAKRSHRRPRFRAPPASSRSSEAAATCANTLPSASSARCARPDLGGSRKQRLLVARQLRAGVRGSSVSTAQERRRGDGRYGRADNADPPRRSTFGRSSRLVHAWSALAPSGSRRQSSQL